MDEVRRLIRETLAEILVNEQANTFFDIGPNIGLVISKDTGNQKYLNLFDFKEKRCVGVITLSNISNRAWGVTTVAADNGFGPVIYEVGMMFVYPQGICVDKFGPTKDGAFTVFKKFADEREDVRKIKVKENDEEFSNRYMEDEAKFYLDNLIFFKTKSIWLKKLIEKGYMLMDKTKISPEIIDYTCREYFKSRYSNG